MLTPDNPIIRILCGGVVLLLAAIAYNTAAACVFVMVRSALFRELSAACARMAMVTNTPMYKPHFCSQGASSMVMVCSGCSRVVATAVAEPCDLKSDVYGTLFQIYFFEVDDPLR